MIAAGTEQVRQSEVEKEMVEEALNEMKLWCPISWMQSQSRDSHLKHGSKECEGRELTVTDQADEAAIPTPEQSGNRSSTQKRARLAESADPARGCVT
jgi:hypothetical protein